MQPIVVAVDFSQTSVHAVEYAVSIANTLNSDVHLVWVDKIGVQEAIYPESASESRNEIKKRFDELIRHNRPQLAKGLNLDYKLRKGKIYREVDSFAQSIRAGMIITGTHGISGFEEYWLGSNAYKILSFTSLPVITIRHDFPVSGSIRKILMLMDGSGETIQKIPFTAKIAKLFGAEVLMLTIHGNNLKSIQRIAEKYTRMASSFFQEHEIPYSEESIVATNLIKTAVQYAVDHQVDLISVMTEQETPVNIYIGAQVQQLISQSPIPIMNITPNEKFKLEPL